MLFFALVFMSLFLILHYIQYLFSIPFRQGNSWSVLLCISQGKKMLAWIFANYSGEGPLKEI